MVVKNKTKGNNKVMTLESLIAVIGLCVGIFTLGYEIGRNSK
jgi:hypothetical protein